MLSRTAEGLFWMSRYIERMSNIARLLDAGRRMDALPQEPDARSTEWASILISAGCRDSYPRPAELELEQEQSEREPDNRRDAATCNGIAASYHQP